MITETRPLHQGNGSNQYEQNPKVSDNAITTQSDIANMIGISVDTLNNYKKLTELIPEIQDLVDTGIVAPSTAVAVYKNEEISLKLNRV